MAIILGSIDDEILYLARKTDFVREAGQNSGLRVNGIQYWCGGRDDEFWCCYWATMILDIAFKGRCPIKRTGSCEFVHKLARDKGWMVDTPVPGDLCLHLDDSGEAHHIGIVTEPWNGTYIVTIAGNTSKDGKSRNGDGVYEHPQPKTDHLRFVHYPRTPL